MKKILLLFITLFLTTQTTKAQTLVLDSNGVTVKWTGTTVPTPYLIAASPRGILEWFAIVDNTTKSNISSYARNNQSGITYFTPPFSSTPIPFNNVVTTLVTNMSNLFNNCATFDQPIASWDVSNVTNMGGMFQRADSFNQPIENWDVSNVTNMSLMFDFAFGFNQPIGNWNVSNVTAMIDMFYLATSFNQPVGNWNVSNVTNMRGMFTAAFSFNQPIASWDVSNVTNMGGMFGDAQSFNQPIGNWDVSNVTLIGGMFGGASNFNQPIASWNVGSATNMSNMFANANSFNQPIGNWDVSNVTSMFGMFKNASSFNQPIGNWDVSNVTDMGGEIFQFDIFGGMFNGAAAFNQPIGNWNVSNVTNMSYMFLDATSFNQPIGNWNVSNVTNMESMFSGAQLSTANYDATLIGWATIGPNETPLKPNVTFSGGNSNYCNGETARNSIISDYGWTITDAGLNCDLSTETFDTIGLKLYPNPVLSVLNVEVDSNFINQTYSIVDGLGRVVLSGILNEVDTAIDVEQLSKGIYYLKLSDSNASKFVKE